MRCLGFKIWYADESMQQSADWNKLPSENVVCVMQYMDECYAPDKHYRVAADGCDWYWWDGESIQTVRSVEAGWEAPPDDIEAPTLKKGVMISDADFERISALAMAEVGFYG